MQKKIVIKTNREAEVSAEELFELRKAAFQQWIDADLYTTVKDGVFERFQQYLKDKVVFVAQDEATGELLGMHTLRLNKRRKIGDGSCNPLLDV